MDEMKNIPDYIISKRSTEPVLLEILVHELMHRSMPEREELHPRCICGNIMHDEFGVSSYRLEHSGHRRTFSRNKDYMLTNCLIETSPANWTENLSKLATHYNTTPLGKVLAMKYWYNEYFGKKPYIIKTNEEEIPPEVWSKFSDDEKGKYKTDMQEGQHILDDGRLGIEVKPDDLLISFFQFLPRLKKFSDDIKKSIRGLGPKEALQFIFSEIDINYAAPNNRAGIEIKFRKHETHVQIIRHFRLDNPDDLGGMYNYILDSITFLFLRNLETMQKELGVKNPVVSKILEDPDLKSFRHQYQMEAKQVLQESLNFLSDDN